MKETYSHEFNWWQMLLKHALGMWRINSDSIDFKWGYFSPRFGFELMLNRGFYFDQYYAITICLVWGTLHLKMPLKTKLEEGCEWPKYGFNLFGNSVMFYWGLKCKVWDIPFANWRYIRQSWHGLNGEQLKIEYANDRSFSSFEYEKTMPKASFWIDDYDGKRIKAETHIEEREWHFGLGWFKWLSWFVKPMIRRSLDIRFSEEVGPEKGSWKGGTVGHGIDMLLGELHEEAFKRYCDEEHRSKHRKYKISYVDKVES